jgi:hypothetical protein
MEQEWASARLLRALKAPQHDSPAKRVGERRPGLAYFGLPARKWEAPVIVTALLPNQSGQHSALVAAT